MTVQNGSRDRGEPAEERVGERPRLGARDEQRPAAPAVDGKGDVVPGRNALRPGRRPQQGDIRILRGEEGQIAVVEHDVHHHRADDARSAAVVDAHPAAGVQQPALLGEERRHLFEQLPAARRLLPGPIGGGLGQVEREAVDHAAGGVVELDRRGEPAGGERRLRPDVERRVDGDRAGARRHRRGDEVRHAVHAIDLVERLAQVQLQIAPLVHDLRGEFSLDRRLTVAGDQAGQGGVERQRRQQQRRQQYQQPGRLGAPPEHAAGPVGRGGHRHQHGEHRQRRWEARAGRMPQHQSGDRSGCRQDMAPPAAPHASADRPEQGGEREGHQHRAGGCGVQHDGASRGGQASRCQRRESEADRLAGRDRQHAGQKHVVVRDGDADGHAQARVHGVAPRPAANRAVTSAARDPPASHRGPRQRHEAGGEQRRRQEAQLGSGAEPGRGDRVAC